MAKNFENKNKKFNKGKFKNKFLVETKDINFYKYTSDGRDMNLSYKDDLNAKVVETFAPLREEGQITSIVGMQGCGKTTTIRNLIKFYYKYYNLKKIAVISINERAGEAKSWQGLDLEYLYCVSSKDVTYTTREKVKIIEAIFKELNKDYFDLVIIDSVTGWYDLVCESGYDTGMGLGASGLNQSAFNYIWRIIANINSKYTLCSVIQNNEVKVYGAINALFNSKADSTIYLEYELLRMNVFNNVNPYKSYTRECEYSELRNNAIKLLNKFGGSFRALIQMGAIPNEDYGRDFIYKM